MKLGIIGCGNVGLNTMHAFQVHGHEVQGYDIAPSQVDHARQVCGPSAGADHLEDLRGCEAVFACVPTEKRPGSDCCDLTTLEHVVREWRKLESRADYRCSVFIQRSTCPPGTANRMAAELHKTPYVVNPSFLAKATQWEDSLHPPRIVLGGPEAALQTVLQAYLPFGPIETWLTPSRAAAELLKYVENITDAVLVSLWNEFLSVADSSGISRADFVGLCGAVATRDRFATTIRVPGAAFGLGCLPKDLAALVFDAEARGISVATMRGAMQTNKLVEDQHGINSIPTQRLICTDSGRVTITTTGIDFLTGMLPTKAAA